MLLDDFVEEERDTLGRWLDGPSPALVLECDSENQGLAARLIGSFAGQDPARAFVGFTGRFSDPDRFYADAARAIGEDLSFDPKDCERYKLRPLRVPPMPGPEVHPRIEVRFAAFLEAAAATVGPLVDALVVTLHFEDAADEALRESLSRLVGALGSPMVKIVVLDRREEPRLRDIEVERHRVRLVHFEAMKTDLVQTVGEARADGTRIVVLQTERSLCSTLRRALARVAEPHVVLDGRFSRARRFWERAHETLLRRQGRDPVDVAWEEYGGPDDPDDLRVLDRAELTFSRAAGTPAEALVVLVDADVRNDDAYRRSIATLATVVPLNVVCLVVDKRKNGALSDLGLSPGRVEHHELHIEAADILPAARDRLGDPELPPLDRMRLLQIAASAAATDGQEEEALDHATASVALADAHGQSEDVANAWLVLGHTLYRLGSFDTARAAFTHTADLALDEGLDPLVAPALMSAGHCHLREEQWNDAIVCYRAATDYSRALKDPFGEGQGLIWMAEAHVGLRSYSEAERYFDEAYRRFDTLPAFVDKASDKGKAEVLSRRAALYEAAGRKGEAGRMRDNAVALGGLSHVCKEP